MSRYVLVIEFDGDIDEDAQVMADDIRQEISPAYRPAVRVFRRDGFTVSGSEVVRS